MTRPIVAIVLLLGSVLAAAGAVTAERDGPPLRPIDAAAPVTGVLSARRVPA
nr:hypothetical protein [Acidimicrobiia bacterium]